MDTALSTARWLSATSFLFFGIACLGSSRMVAEFARYGLARFRVLVGCLEVGGALGLMFAALWPPLLPLAALGLSLLMALGVLTRILIRDALPQMLPALALLALNLFLALHALGGWPDG